MKAEGNRAGCVFCKVDRDNIGAANALALAIRDIAPVTPLHSLVPPKRHAPSFFDLSEPETRAIERLVRLLGNDIKARDESVKGFNIGINIGEVAGQTVFHRHYHLIPRRCGDVADPRGGVRWIIPLKGKD